MRESKGLGGPAGGGGKSFERPKQNAAVILKRLWKYLARSRWLVLLAILISVASNLLALVGPKLSGYAVDALRPGTGQVDFDAVLYYAKWMLIAYLVSAALSYLLAALMVRIARDVVYRLRRDVFEHLMRLPVRFYDSHTIGDALSVLSYDIDTISTMLSTDLIQMMTNLLTVVGSFFMMLTISPGAVSALSHHHPGVHPVYPLPGAEGAAPLPGPLCRSGRAERLRRGDDRRPGDHPCLWPEQGLSRPL